MGSRSAPQCVWIRPPKIRIMDLVCIWLNLTDSIGGLPGGQENAAATCTDRWVIQVALGREKLAAVSRGQAAPV